MTKINSVPMTSDPRPTAANESAERVTPVPAARTEPTSTQATPTGPRPTAPSDTAPPGTDPSPTAPPGTDPSPTAPSDTGPPGTVPPRPGGGNRWARIARAACFPLAVYGTALLLHLALLAVMNPPGGDGVGDRLLSWDADWFTALARDGYPDSFTYTPDGQLTGNGLAFFPAYPFLIRAVHTVTGLGYEASALVGAHLALIVALMCVHRLLLRLYGRRTARIATALVVCAQPMALVFFMGYNESLFLAFAAGALLAVHREAWLTAGVLTLLACLTRPVGVAVVAALAVAVALHARREGRFSWRPALALVLGGCGTPAYLLWVGLRLGRLDAWFTLQEAGWETHWDNGRAFVTFLGDALTRGDGWVPVSTALLLLALVGVTVAAWGDKDSWPPLLVHGTIIVIMTLGQSNFFHSKLRLLIAALVFLIPVARALTRVRPPTAIIALSTAALFCSWYGAYMLTTWGYAI